MDVQSIEESASQTMTTDLTLTPSSFDAVFSNAAIHWCKTSPTSVIQNAWNALKPGGRFVAEMGGFGNLVGTPRMVPPKKLGSFILHRVTL